jgi:uncharacterized protein (DUF1697 family)
MPIYISMLRGINVGGNRKIRMEELRAVYKSLGMEGPQTLLQSGNVVFQSDLSDRPALARQLEEGIEQRFGFHSDILLRTLDEFRAVIRRNPLSAEHADPGKRVVMFLSASPAQDAIDDLLKAYAGPETIHITRQEAYLYYPDGQGRSKLSNAFIERKLNVSGTARNWNTVTRLLDLAERFKEP